ncbi:response regulator receiver protein [Methanoregula boonei 6A8]|jgi:CheY-like chemotaxis protein|uniref:Response regulator receiver protein n=1 Tax=Methanoregula boonei (strain DSM 21154 / JCM 14090 / 6A8) TaxID=456442 RepID=A7I904_METB6|nr:response regulator [Methanoregula boonei]ABS56215.1 response regulator receiver protein [Methanoregula boonei 6A8]
MGQVRDGPAVGISPSICIPSSGSEVTEKAPKKPGAKISVLYVEDRPFLLDVVKWYLESGGGIVVESAQSIADAVQKIGICRIDVVVIDYHQMGETTGTVLFQLKREFGISTPFIFFALSPSVAEEEARQSGQMQWVRNHTLSGIEELKRLIHVVLKCPGSCHEAREFYKSREYHP